MSDSSGAGLGSEFPFLRTLPDPPKARRPDFEKMVQTLKVFRKPGMSINAAPQAANLFNISAPPNVAENTIFNPQGGSEGRPFKKEKNDSMFWILLGADAIGFLVWRRRKQQGG